MFKAIYQDKIIAINETDDFPCLVYDSSVEDTTHILADYQQVEGEFLLKQDLPADYQNEAIRATREQLYIQTSDKLRNDYLEAVARGSENVEELKTAWLESKDKIRAENPYLVEEVSAEA